MQPDNDCWRFHVQMRDTLNICNRCCSYLAKQMDAFFTMKAEQISRRVRRNVGAPSIERLATGKLKVCWYQASTLARAPQHTASKQSPINEVATSPPSLTQTYTGGTSHTKSYNLPMVLKDSQNGYCHSQAITTPQRYSSDSPQDPTTKVYHPSFSDVIIVSVRQGDCWRLVQLLLVQLLLLKVDVHLWGSQGYLLHKVKCRVSAVRHNSQHSRVTVSTPWYII